MNPSNPQIIQMCRLKLLKLTQKDVDNSDELTGGKGMNLQTGNLFQKLEKKMVKAKRILGPRKKLKVILRI